MQNIFKELEKVDYDRAPVNVLRFQKNPHVRCFPLHWHDRIELLRVEKGDMVVSCGSTDIQVKENETVLINSKEVHSAVSGNNGVTYSCIMFELAPYVNNGYYGSSYIKPLLFRQMRFKNFITDENINSLLAQITLYFYQELPTSALRIESCLLMLLASLVESYVNTDPDVFQSNSDIRFTEVLDYIDTHFTDDLSISGLAQQFGYNKSYFCRKFKDQTGITCIDYISSLRLDYAAIMLKGTPYSISEISEKCGYPDANYFSRCFKEKYGVSPGEYKKNK